jgi:DNA recombination protein RmuC
MMFVPIALSALIAVVVLLTLTMMFRNKSTDELIRKLHQESNEKLIDRIHQNLLEQQKALAEFKETIQENLHKLMATYGELMRNSVEKLTDQTDQRLKEISGQVEKRLSEGFEKTTETFQNVIKRLALIDEAQKKITELSSSVISLQEVLADKRSRGAFGEVQLSGLIHNMLPENSFSLQHTLSNSTRADCILFLPHPTGHIVIDAKFPLENYRQMTDVLLAESDRASSERLFKLDIKKHIQDIASKYIISGETSDGAMMFIPAEAIFAEIHGHYPDLVEYAQKNRVWMVSPTTMMAILTTARAVLKDEATRKQVHIIQEHLGLLAKDFERFEGRMNNLATHIHQASKDVDDVHKSAQKITSRFSKIEKVELGSKEEVELLQ